MDVLSGRLRTLVLAAEVGLGTLLFFFLVYFVVVTFLPANVRSLDLCVLDCYWYGAIATDGYSAVPNIMTLQTRFGFFPAFPIAASLLTDLTGMPFKIAGLTLNACFSLLFCWLVLEYRSELGLKSERDALTFLTVFLLSPWSLYNRVPYSEMLFNIGSLATFIAWRRKNYPFAAISGFIVSLTRFSGVLLPLALCLELLIPDRGNALKLLVRPDGKLRALAIMPLGLVAFMLFLYFQTGDPLAYVHAEQVGWNQGLRNPFTTLWGGLWAGPSTQYSVVAFIVTSLALLWGTHSHRIPVSLALFAWLAPAVAITSVLVAQPRFSLALFPIYLIAPAAPRGLRLALIAVLAMGQAAFLFFWLQASGTLQ
jgi:hypothetical protein